MTAVPRIDVAPLIDGCDVGQVAANIDRACREVGFFSIVNHGVDPALCLRLDALAREFFARPVEEKQRVAMIHGGTAWRGWFPLHGELTSGTPDHKEGYYFGRELAPADPRVESGVPLHGPNLWPEEPHELRSVLTEYLNALESLGQHLTRAFSVALDLGPDTLQHGWFRDPVILLRLFRYPPAAADSPPKGVGEHTDYGFLTMLWQDRSGGLEVRTDQGWVEVPPDSNAFVCNIGDMLDRLTAGRYRSTAHRVRSPRTTIASRFPSSSTPTGTRGLARCPSGARHPLMMPTAVGTARAFTPSKVPTASISSARSRRCSRISELQCWPRTRPTDQPSPASSVRLANTARRRSDGGRGRSAS